MAFKVTRKPSRDTNGKRSLALPKAWCDYFGERIDRVTVVGQNVLIIAPQGLEERALKLIKEDHDD